MSLSKLPGMVDVHVHLREPGATHKEDFYTGTRAALAGGVTMILDMPNNPIPTISAKALRGKEKLASLQAVCDYGLIFGASQLGNTDEFQKVISGACALKIYMDQTTGTLLVDKLKLLETIFHKWPSKKPIMVHAEEGTLAKALSLAFTYGKHVHCCHVSLAEEVELIRKAKAKGLLVTSEVTPHHLFLTTAEQKKLGPYGIMKPPLRSRSDVEALWKGVKDGTIDMVATDHAPHTKSEKAGSNPPYGVPGLETALALLLLAVKQKRLTLKRVIELYHSNPIRIFKLPKQPNTYVEVDMGRQWKVEASHFQSKSKWSSFEGWVLPGRVVHVVVRGKSVYRDGNVLVKGGFGRNIRS